MSLCACHDELDQARLYRMRWMASLLVGALAVVAVHCKATPPQDRGPGQRCAQAGDCAQGLRCVEQVCEPAPEPLDGSPEGKEVPSDVRTRECKLLIKVINEQSASYQGLKVETPVERLRLADALQAAAKTIAEVRLRNGELRAIRDDYQKMTAELGKAARSAGLAGTNHDRLEEALETMDAIGPREDRILRKLNNLCRAR